MKTFFLSIIFFLSFSFLGIAQNDQDLIPLKSMAPDGIGPLSLPHLRHMVLGSAFVYNGDCPDLFIAGTGKTTELYLYKWLRNTENGVPIFDKPHKIASPFKLKGTIFQTDDHNVHALWLKKDSVIHTVFNLKKQSFDRIGGIELPELASLPQSIAARINKDQSVDLFLELVGHSIPAKYANQNPSSKEWRPYDEAGVSTTPLHYTYLCNIRYPRLLSGTPSVKQMVTHSRKETRWGMMNIAMVTLRKNDMQELICGSRLGNFTYYSRPELSQDTLSPRHYVVGSDNILLQHPSISASVCSYVDVKSGTTNIIAGGEGAVYFYKYSGEFTLDGHPVFSQPSPVLQVDADLYCGTLPVPSVIDWDGDGIEDIIVGNSDGHVLFFKNIGNNNNPRFIPKGRVQADGKDIHIQAGYSGSVQGTPESRWGYLSPTVVDWTGDGLPDIIMGDITGKYTLYVNKGTRTEPKLDAPQPFFCEGLELHGMWRSRAAVAKFGNRMALAIVDDNDLFHLYWKIDNFHLEDGGELKLENGSSILTSAEPAGGTGRCKLNFFDYDGDGLLDLIIGTGRRSAIPNMETGYPLPILGKKTMGTPLFMKNVGSSSYSVFAHPSPFKHPVTGLVQPGGSHESGAVGTKLGGGTQRNLLVGNEVGRLYLLKGEHLELMTADEVKKYRNKPNPFPGFPHPGEK